jgi:hypothetical protein
MTQSNYLILPLHRQSGQDLDYLPGFLASKAPRRASRARKGDHLWFFITFAGAAPFDNIQIQELLSDMSRGYFLSSGSATSALLEQAERFNTFLFEQNQKEGLGDGTAVAFLTAFLARPTRLILSQSGPAHAFHVRGDAIEHYYDPENAGRGLGLARAANARFYDLAMQAEDYLLVTHSIPESWNESTLKNITGQRLATLRRRFLGDAGEEFEGLLMNMREGTPGIQVLGSAQELSQADPKSDSPSESVENPVDAFVESGNVDQELESETWEQIDVPEVDQADESSDLPKEAELQLNIRPMAQAAGSDTPRIQERISALLNIAKRGSDRVQLWLSRLLPDDGEFNLPSSTMAWIAGLVPVAVVLIVTLLYFQVGRGELYRNYLTRAQASIAEAGAISDPLQARTVWEEALQFAQQAQNYDANEEVNTVLLQAQSALDEMDGIVRLDFQLALFEELETDTRISHMLATNTDLFLLNESNGTVMRAFLTGGGYQIDDNFQCGPGPYGGLSVGPLIDITLLPRDNPQDAALVGMDANGNIVYCIVDERPTATALQAPNSGWGTPSAIAIDDQNLYVLDPLTNAIWIYPGEDFAFVDDPIFYFGLEVPNLREVLDIAVNESQLFLLNNLGSMVICQRTNDADDPAECEDPAEYQDGRPGRSDGPLIDEVLFLQMQASDPPEPSLYQFDPVSRAIYQFSLRLNLVRQYQSAEALPEELGTAFAVSPNRAVFLAIENQLYIAFLP